MGFFFSPSRYSLSNYAVQAAYIVTTAKRYLDPASALCLILLALVQTITKPHLFLKTIKFSFFHLM